MKKNILVMTVGIFVSLLLAEGLLRILEIKKLVKVDRGILSAMTMYVSPYVNVFKPYSSRVVNNKAWQINRYGLRDVDFSLNKPNNTYRIAVVGDSITFGFGVDLDESYPKILEKNLNHMQQGKVNYEVLNFAIPGFSPLEYEEIYKNLAYKFHSDLIVVGYYLGNDPSGAIGRELESKYISWHALPDKLFPFGVNEFLRNHSSLWLLLLNKYYAMDRTKIYREETSVTLRGGKDKTYDYYDKDIEPSREIMRGWEISEKAINSIINKANTQKAKVVVFGISAQEHISSYAIKELSKKGYKIDDRILKDPAARRVFIELCKKNMWVCADTYESLSRQKDKEALFIKDDSHFTYQGNKIVADYLTDFLIDNKVIEYSKVKVE